MVEELDRTRAYDFLKRLTDCHRMHLFDVVMQYRAIFADDTSSVEAAEGADGGLLYRRGGFLAPSTFPADSCAQRSRELRVRGRALCLEC